MEAKTFKNWWFLMLNGIIALLAGILFLFFTEETISTIMRVFGGIILAVGLVQLVIAIINLNKEKQVFTSFILAVLYLAIGLFILLFPDLSIRIFFILLGAWASILGVFQLILLVITKKTQANNYVILFNGILTLITGLILVFKPFEVAGFVGKLIGFLLIVTGAVLFYLSIYLRKIKETVIERQGS